MNSQMGMKLLASLVATETSKDRQVPVVGATERCSFAAGEGIMDESTIKCYVDKMILESPAMLCHIVAL